MKILLFGASGMVGQGVLKACLAADDVDEVLAVGRTLLGVSHAKLRELVKEDLFDWRGAERQLAGFDACFFCLGVSSTGMSETGYTRITYELTMAVAEVLAQVSPGSTFVYVSGAGTDSTERGRTMWARVKGKTENALLALPLKAVMFRPAAIQPLDGIRPKAPAYRVAYTVLRPVLPALRGLFPRFVTTTDRVGRAMLQVAREGSPKAVLENHELDALADSPPHAQ